MVTFFEFLRLAKVPASYGPEIKRVSMPSIQFFILTQVTERGGALRFVW